MSQENVEIVRGLVAALNRVDVDAMITRYYSADAEFIPAVQAAVEGTVYRGSEQIQAYYAESFDVWDELHVELEDVRDVGDMVVASGRVKTKGKTSGAELDRPWGFAFRLANGKVVWQRNFADRSEALKAVGLQ